MTDGTGTTTRTYDAFNRCTSKTVPGFGTSTFDYDITEGLETGYSAELTIDSAGNQTLRMYDRMGRLVQVMTAGQTFRYFYNANGSLQCLNYNGISREDYTYTLCGQVETLANRKADGTIIDAYTYVYDAAHNLTQKTDSKGITDYTYDASNRLLTVTEPSGKVTVYTFDGAGNRATQTVTIGIDVTVTTYTYDALNRLTLLEKTLNTVLFERQQFAYDSNGNQLLTTCTTYVDGIPGTPVVTQQNTYDLRNQLIRTVTENGTIVENVYNGDGLRVEKIVNGTATFYLYEYQRVVLEQNSLGDVTGRNVYGTNLLMRTVGVDAFFYMYNAHADVTALLSTNGTIIATYYYDAFGNILEQTGSAGNSILFAGYQYDKETGMYYLNARMYDPVTARFMQEDTYTGQYMDPLSLNLYTYCHNEPLMYSDPTGHSYVYHGQTLSEDSTSDNMAQRAQRQAMNAEYSGKHISNAAEAAMVSAGFGGKAFKAPARVTKSVTITEEAKEEQNHEPPTPCPTPTPTPLNPDAKKNWFESFIDEERYSDTPLGKLIRTFDVAGQAVNGIGGAIKGTGEALGAGAYAGIDTGVAFFERMTGSISADELLYRYTNNMKTIDSIKYGTTAGAMETVAGAPFSILGAAEYISNGTNFINESTSNYISEADDKIVNSLDLNREDYENAKGIIPTCLLVVSLGAQYNSLRAQDAISKGTRISGKGSTGRTTANNLTEQLAMEEVISNPLEGAKQLTSVKMTDSRWPASEGWVKMSKNVNGVETHYVYNTKTGAFDDFKFK